MTTTNINSSNGSLPPAIKLSQEQVRDVRDTLRKPLTDQQVLIPLGSKAFFPGTLQPSVSDDGQEQVALREKDGSDKIVTRQDALDSLQAEIDSFKPTPRTKTAAKTKSALRTSTNGITASAPQYDAQPLGSPLPYFEIREEYNDAGEPITAQAIDVTKQLEYLQKQANGESVVHIPPEAKQDDIPVTQTAVEEVHVDILKPLTDHEYDEKASRLEELMRMEEQATSSQEPVVNPKIKSLRGKGWSKGFLNSSNSKKTSKNKPPAEAANTASAKTERKVVFHDENQVKEIPRIGERSISEVRKPAAAAAASRQLQESILSGIVGERPAVQARKEIEESVLSGVVRERPVGGTVSQQQQQQPEAAPKKRLSRFAQQRQQH